MENHSYGLIDNWLTNIKSVYQSKKKWLDGLEQTEREALMVELNVINSLHILCQTPVVQSAWSRGQPITVHGWSYNIENGRIYDLNARVTSPNDVEKVYWEAFQTKIHSVKSIGRE
ncbi:hypothetical protein K7432_013663 [Basidiobolus ranarum]|uniref:Carbonic anhydrase n=1 Tax=Basidiobolus ranarum TaxID=34480 RepID=A0ABR2VQG2_9FUNG